MLRPSPCKAGGPWGPGSRLLDTLALGPFDDAVIQAALDLRSGELLVEPAVDGVGSDLLQLVVGYLALLLAFPLRG